MKNTRGNDNNNDKNNKNCTIDKNRDSMCGKKDIPNLDKLEPALYLVATPIGNLEDITLRALRVLKNCDQIFCEDRRVTGKLLTHHGIEHSKLGLYNDHSDDNHREYIANLIASGASIALVSDAGVPTVADPGYKLVNSCLEKSLKIIPVPGCSACLTALCASGMASDKFYFYGFLSHSTNVKQNELKKLLGREETVICYESPQRLVTTLEILRELDANRKICVARELTKMFEEIKTDRVTNLLEYYNLNPTKIKGEFVLLLAGKKFCGETLGRDAGDIFNGNFRRANNFAREEIDDIPTDSVMDMANCKSDSIKLELNKLDYMLKSSLKYLSLRDAADLFSETLNINRGKLYEHLLALREEK